MDVHRFGNLPDNNKLGLSGEVRELKIGQSFTNPKSVAFHAIKYDFKPMSVDPSKIATLDVTNTNQVTMTVPHLDGAGTPQTVFKGSQKPYSKECVLIIDKITGEVTLEKLSSNLQVKKTRTETFRAENPPRPPTIVAAKGSPAGGQRTSSKTRVTSGGRRAERNITHLVPKHSPLQASPNYPSPKRELMNLQPDNPNALASLPMIGMDDFSDNIPPAATPLISQPVVPSRLEKSPPLLFTASDHEGNGVEEMSDSSSSSSSSDSDSDTEVRAAALVPKTNGHSNGVAATQKVTQAHLLNEDLCLSESGSDSD